MPGFHSGELAILGTTIFWLVALIHCITNKKVQGGEKIGWVLMIALTSSIGALIYFIFWYGFAKNRRSQVSPQQQSYQQPYTPEYAPYEQGYQPVNRTTPPVFSMEVPLSKEGEQENYLYEQQQVMYPADPR